MESYPPFTSTPVSGTYQTDKGPGKHRIGLIVLSNDYVTERDFINMRPSDDVALFTSRVQNSQDCTLETLPRMAPHISDAAALLVPDGQLDVIAYACTSGTVVMGYEEVSARICRNRAEVKVVTPITAAMVAFRRLDAQRLSVLTPYTEDVNHAIADHLVENGKDVRAFTSFHIEDNEVMAALPTEAIFHAALEADQPDADALFISCTAIRAVDVIQQIEDTIGKPVVTANQAMIWQSLRWSGYQGEIANYGKLLHLSHPT
ncbi:hypothetical protein [uncultured Roseovarius sp.]|uniref:maleate cis-trans isomerase family protein n=1 Tax=uncultured Roseovarius sp. TaxID=293344 RepID=UPI00262FCC24|nr:hypothetical protein [uncultured Roseovarius sp.]